MRHIFDPNGNEVQTEFGNGFATDDSDFQLLKLTRRSLDLICAGFAGGWLYSMSHAAFWARRGVLQPASPVLHAFPALQTYPALIGEPGGSAQPSAPPSEVAEFSPSRWTSPESGALVARPQV